MLGLENLDVFLTVPCCILGKITLFTLTVVFCIINMRLAPKETISVYCKVDVLSTNIKVNKNTQESK